MASASYPRAGEAALGGRSRQRTQARSSGARRAAAVPRVRWDRVGRVALLFVLVALVYLYISAGFHMFSTWRQSRHDGAAVVRLEKEHSALVRQHQALGSPVNVEASARKLGLMRSGEQPYVVTGLPNN